MHSPHSNAKLTLIIVAVVFTVLTCSKQDNSPVEPNPNPTALTVSPSSGAPGTLLSISGYTITPADTATEIYIGGELSVFLQDSSGIQTMIPLFLDSASHWPAPPSKAQDVEIRKDGNVVARASAAVSVDSLQHADGATEMLRQDFIKLTGSLRVIYSSLPTIPGEDPRLPGYRDAILAMLDSLTSATDSSLGSVMQGTSTWNIGPAPDMSLMDGLLASSGALDFFNEAAGSLGRLTDSLTLARQQGDLCKGSGEDMDLACQMQIFVVLDDYANYFVKPTTTTYANTVGMAAGLIALSGVGVPAEAIIGALLTVFDFVYGTIAPSLFPSEITEFSLTVATDTVAVDELTNTAVLVSAINHPASIRATQVLDMLLKMLGVTKTRSTDLIKSATAFLKNAMSWALGMYRDAVIQSNTQSGGAIFIDPTADIPQMTWGPVMVTHSDLVQLYSFTEDFITADTGSFEWKGISRGEGRIQARGRGAGERSRVLFDNALCLGCVYSGGAFGNNAPGTETKTVVVGKPAQLAVVITGLPDGTNASVVVTGPGGYSSGTLPATDTLRGLDAGNYHLTALDVTDNTGEQYVAKPMDTTVTLTGGDDVSVAIAYKKKFGNILLTVAGLPSGVAPDISISGPNGFQEQIFSEGLIDSLLAGDYTIKANDVVNTRTGDTLAGKPSSQIITVVGGQTSVATVDYSSRLEVTVFYGPTGVLGRASAEYTTHGEVTDGNEQFATDGYDTTDFEIANCLVTGYSFGGVSGAANAGSSVSSASASGAITVSSSGFSISSTASATASLPMGSVGPEHAASANANLNFGGGSSITGLNNGVVVDIVNPSQDTVDIYISWTNSATSASSGTNFVGGVSHVGLAMAIPFDPCGGIFAGNDVILSGCNSPGMQFHCTGDTLVTTTLNHIQAAFTTEVSAGANFRQSDFEGLTGSGTANLSLQVFVRKR